MEGFVYEWVLDCGNSEYDWGRNPLPLRCPDCGIKDWKHDHIQRWRVIYLSLIHISEPTRRYAKS